MPFEYVWILILAMIVLAWLLYVLSSMRPILTEQLTFKTWWMIARRDTVIMVGLIIASWAICIIFLGSLFTFLQNNA